MGKLRVLVVFFVAAALLWCFVPNPVSACQPGPCRWDGSAEVNGVGVPAGTAISAWINGVKWAETTTGSMAGQEASEFRIEVPADNPYTSDVIEGGKTWDRVFFKIKRPYDADWLAARINSEDSGVYFAECWYFPVLLTAEVPAFATVEGQVHLQGRPAPPDSSWETPLTVKFFQTGTDNVVGTEDVTTDNEGKFTVADVASDTYDIGVKCPRSLSELVSGVVLPAGATIPVDFGTLREGDANNDDVITGLDYAMLWSFFGQTAGEALDKCDFNRDGAVTGMDYSLLWNNFDQIGDMYGM